jgi:hypothetical protein
LSPAPYPFSPGPPISAYPVMGVPSIG